ncbi:MAG: ArnT family glycosyltransferase [Planctomycetota bacterium]
MKSRERWIEAALCLIPLLVGICFWADTSGHGDGPIYREFILDFHRTGILPLLRLEWYHPGHYLMVWPVFAIGALLGCWDDPLHAIQLVNLVGTGLAAVLVYRMWPVLFQDHDPTVALLPGLALATLPAWLWQSQEAMSDVVGAVLVLSVIGRLLLHDLRGDTTWAPYLLTGFLAAWSFLVRVSTALFLPMMAYLLVRLLVRRRHEVPWQRVLQGLLLGGLVPLALVYGYLIQVHGWTVFRDLYFVFGWHNTNTAERLVELPSTIKTWGGNLLRGMGPGVFLALIGCVLLLVQHRLFLWLALLMLPYLAGVANNHAGVELRYMVPVMACVSLGYGAIGHQLHRWLGRWGVRLCLGVVIVLNAVHALPMLEIVRTRQHFGEVAARHMVDVAPKESLLIGVATHPFLRLLRDEDHAMCVRPGPETAGRDLWNRHWLSAKDVVTHHLQRGRHVYCCSEPGMEGFRQWLQGAGFREQVMATVPADGLRDVYDQMLSRVDPQAPVLAHPLSILRLMPPARLDTVALRATPRLDETPPGLRLEVHAPAHAGRDYRILVGTTTTDRFWLANIDLPFTTGDIIFQTSLGIGNKPWAGLRGFRGTIDADGHAEAFLPARFLIDTKDLIAPMPCHRLPWHRCR